MRFFLNSLVFLVVTTNDNPNVYDDPYESPNIYEGNTVTKLNKIKYIVYSKNVHFFNFQLEIDVNQEFPLPEVEYEYIYTTTL